MDLITNNPGLQHLAKEIFKHLNYINLEKCAQVNDSWKMICETPSLLLSVCIINGHFKEANKFAWQQIIRDTDQKNLEKLGKDLKRILDHNKFRKCVKRFCIFCYNIFTIDEHRLDWQQLDDILQVPYEGQIKNPNIFGLFICPYKNCGKQFPQKLLFQDHLELFHYFPQTFSIYVDFSTTVIVTGK